MSKRGDQYLAISTRIKQAKNRMKKTKFFNINFYKNELYPTHNRCIGSSDLESLNTLDVSFNHEDPLFSYTEAYSKEQVESLDSALNKISSAKNIASFRNAVDELVYRWSKTVEFS